MNGETMTPATLVQLLSVRTQVRLQVWTGVDLVEPPTPSNPKTYVRAAQEIVGEDPIVSAGQAMDRWRLSLLLVAFDLQIDPQAIADICVALGDPPSVEAAQAKLAALQPDARALVDAVLAELAVQR